MTEEINKEIKERPQNANLKPVQPGQVLNPNGRPKGSLNRKTLFTRALEMAAAAKAAEEQRRTLGDEHNPATIAEQLVARLVIDGLAGDKAAIAMLMDGALDKVPEKQDLTHSFGALLAQAKAAPGELPKYEGEDAIHDGAAKPS